MGLRRKTTDRLFLVGAVLYLIGLPIGYIRLPWAAVHNLRDYGLIRDAKTVTFDPLDLSGPQEWYLKHQLRESPVPTVPRISVHVEWNAILIARATSGHYVGNTGAEGMDALYVCIFGAWVRVYTFGNWMA